MTPPPSPDLPPMPSTPAPNLDDFAPSLMTTFANETPRSADGPGGSAFEGLVFDGPYDGTLSRGRKGMWGVAGCLLVVCRLPLPM